MHANRLLQNILYALVIFVGKLICVCVCVCATLSSNLKSIHELIDNLARQSIVWVLARKSPIPVVFFSIYQQINQHFIFLFSSLNKLIIVDMPIKLVL